MLETMDTKHYTVAWLCVHPIEEEIVRGMLHETHKSSIRLSSFDPNSYTLGRMGHHMIVIAGIPAGTKGRGSIEKTVKQIQFTLLSILLWVLVGTGSGIPNRYCDIRLEDVVAGTPGPTAPGVVEFTVDGGDRIQRTGYLLDPSDTLVTASATFRNDPDPEGSQIPLIMNDLFSKHPDLLRPCSHPGQRRDILFRSEYQHAGTQSCGPCDIRQAIRRRVRSSTTPVSHRGYIASSTMPVGDGVLRNQVGVGVQGYLSQN